MKLLAISTSCFTASNREFYRRLQNDGIEVNLIIPTIWDFGKGAVQADPKLENDPDITFLTPSNFHHRLFRLKGITQLINELSPDVIYFEGDPGSLMAAFLGKQAKKKSIRFFALSCENLSQSPIAVIKREGVKQFFHASIKYVLIQYTRKKIDTLFVINNQGLNYFKQLGFSNVVKTPLGFNEKIFKVDPEKRKQVRKRLQISDDAIVIAYFGRLVYEKGVHLLIEALEKMKPQNWVFLIDEFSRYKTDYQAEIEALIEQSNFKNKTIFFEADHTEIANFMNASDITVLPSIPTKKWVEQYGRVVPEAMACGNLLIVSDQGAQTDFFEKDYSYIFPSGDYKALQKLIEKGIKEISLNQNISQITSSSSIDKFNMKSQINLLLEALNNGKKD